MTTWMITLQGLIDEIALLPCSSLPRIPQDRRSRLEDGHRSIVISDGYAVAGVDESIGPALSCRQ